MATRKVSKRGHDLIRDPRYNKGTAFSKDERLAFGIQGFLPSEVNNLEQQSERSYQVVADAPTPLSKYVALAALHDRNETLFYRVLMDNLEALMPIVYTPTVGLATQNFSRVFQRGRGVWITPESRGRIEEVLRSGAEGHPVDLLVVTDNEAILGIGDQGAGGMAISVGKLALYVAGAGISPARTLPISLDVGTNNEKLLEDPLYLGWPHPRLSGEEYDSLVEEFVQAVRTVFPGALLQWEDFRKDNALGLLDRYRSDVLSFNDDIQGTGAVALAGVLSALRADGVSLADQRIVIYGAGAAGLGIARQIKAAMMEMQLSEEEARHRIAVLDSGGLVVKGRPRMDEYKLELAWDEDRGAGLDGGLVDVIQAIKPTVLIGSSGRGGAFDQAVVEAMAAGADRPVILPFSNPTDCAEAVPEDVLAWSGGRAHIATGSPFQPVELPDGRKVEIGQGNNVFVFPGLGLGALACAATQVTDGMVSAAAAALASSVTDDELSRGLLYPDIARLREVSMAVAEAVVEAAERDGVSTRTASFDVWEAVYRDYEPV